MEYGHVSVFKRLIAKLIESGVPYKVNIAGLSRTLGITPPTLNTYLDILNDTKIFPSKNIQLKSPGNLRNCFLIIRIFSIHLLKSLALMPI